jgi:hypothetical protein
MAKRDEGKCRMDASVPAELKERMDEAGNGSVVVVAGERKVTEIAARRPARDRKAVIARLKAAEAREAGEMSGRGREAGRRWAEKLAAPADLRRMETCQAFDFDGIGNAVMPGEAGAFWEWAVGEEFVADNIGDVGTDAFCHGFRDAALEVWNDVKAEL